MDTQEMRHSVCLDVSAAETQRPAVEALKRP